MDAVFSHSPVPSRARVEYLLKCLILHRITLRKFFYIRNHFISKPVLDRQKFKKF